MEWGTDGTEANCRARWRYEEALYRYREDEDHWPSDDCDECQSHGGPRKLLFITDDGTRVVLGGASCCQHWSHHVGSFCLHCGSDERSPYRKEHGRV